MSNYIWLWKSCTMIGHSNHCRIYWHCRGFLGKWWVMLIACTVHMIICVDTELSYRNRDQLRKEPQRSRSKIQFCFFCCSLWCQEQIIWLFIAVAVPTCSWIAPFSFSVDVHAGSFMCNYPRMYTYTHSLSTICIYLYIHGHSRAGFFSLQVKVGTCLCFSLCNRAEALFCSYLPSSSCQRMWMFSLWM